MKLTFPSWYEQIEESRKFWDEFIEQIETQLQETISRFETGKEVNVEIQDEEFQYLEEDYKGFDSITYDIDNLFKVYFPNLQRRSALITLYSFLEFELNKLCDELKEKNNINISFIDLKSDGIERASNYLTKVINLSWNKGKGVWGEIKKIQNIRNKIVHNNGKIDIENIDKDFLKYIIDSQFLFGEKDKENFISEIVIKEGFLTYVLEKFYELFDEINQTIPN